MSTADSRLDGLPSHVIAWLQAGARALRDGRRAQAVSLLQQACAAAPEHPEPLRYLALAMLQGRDPQAARQLLEQALRLAPDDALLHSDLGAALAAADQIDAALDAWRHAVRHDPQLAQAWFNLGRNLQLQGETTAAIDALHQACALLPQALPPRILLGDALVHAGRFHDAIAQYRAALAVHPACGDAWRGLSNIKTLPLTDADAALLRAQLARPDLAEPDRIAMLYALGKLEEDHGRLAEALAAFSAANARQKRLTPWRADAFRRYVASALKVSQTLPQPLDPQLGREVIFIVGLPRSGSTLFEQILAAHPDVEGASELPDLGIVIQQESVRRGIPYPDWVPQASAADWHRLGQAYLARTARWRRQRPRHTDKQPDNWKHVGMLRAMLPGAQVIEVRRDPLETAWSCFKQPFYSQPHFANDMADIALYMQGCAHAMDHWRERDPQHIHVYRYEALLADPEPYIRALLADCGLAFHPDCLQFHTTPRSVRTASAAQVRQPLRRDTARAIAYGALLQPLMALLELPLPL
ncbi:MAG: sulfotransferase [Thermomonas hydrothermalis]|uniref:tetratricopeptide repeat-containing sulfotransferase family protein n=1 Tax=Thermomonas hydrothermalis TaxID=213588 RepID=UPI0023535B9D|nr:tetratricopeptide repeat-containing sulfotransferase family protein [Thermomonas hydrothermalis]MCL6620107.1 sulfotransferase [Thermomonas hydrothermalis]